MTTKRNGVNHQTPAPTKKGKPPILLTDPQLRVIHRDLLSASWQPDEGYEERQAIIEALDAYFGDDKSHLD